MKKQFITGFISGALIFGVAGVLAATYTATDNPFPVQLNGNNVQIEGYNIEGSTYFKLRDIADVVGGFNVGFQNNTIQLAKDGYAYETISIITEEDAQQAVIKYMQSNGWEGIGIKATLGKEDANYYYYENVLWYNDGALEPGYRRIMGIEYVSVNKYTGEVFVKET